MKKLILVLLISTLSLSTNAYSSTSGVSSPSVTKGKIVTEFRTSIVSDDTASEDKKFRTRQSIQYGISNSIAARVILNQVKPNDDSWEHSDLDAELRFKMFDEKTDGFGAATHVRYETSDNDKSSDEIEFRLMLRKYFGDIELRHNTILKHEVGRDSRDGLNAELRWQLGKKIESRKLKLGLEVFNDFSNLKNLSGYSDQAHEIGPFISGKLTDGLSYHLRGLFGISDDADNFSTGLFLKKNF